jgi:hypothetical protein
MCVKDSAYFRKGTAVASVCGATSRRQPAHLIDMPAPSTGFIRI